MWFIKNRRSFFVLCFSTYAGAYLCRLNLSIALEKIGVGFGISSAQTLTGFGTTFFVVYAVTQLCSGFLGDRLNPISYVSVAAWGIAISNFLISQMSSVEAVLLLWCLNAVFQAMLWGPIMRMLSMVFPGEAKNRVALGMVISQIAGYVLAWGGLGQILIDSSWRYYFLIPSLVAVFPAGCWLYVCVTAGKIGEGVSRTPVPGRKRRDIFATIRNDRLWLVGILCILCGIIKESFSMWAPVILTMLLGMDVQSSLLFLMMFPFGQALGSLFSAWLIRNTRDKIRVPLIVEYGVMTVCCAGLFVPDMPVALIILLMVMISAMANAGGNTYFGFLPMSYRTKGMVSTLSGSFDFCSYVGSALSSFVFASVLSGESITPLAMLWGGIAVVSIVLTALVRIPEME